MQHPSPVVLARQDLGTCLDGSTATGSLGSHGPGTPDREIGKQFSPLWKVLAKQLKILFPESDGAGAYVVPALDARSQVLSVKDQRNGVGKLVIKLAPFGSGQLFALVAPDMCVLGVPGEVLQKVISQASTAKSVMAAPSPHRFLPLGGSRALFPRFPSPMGSAFCALFESLPDRKTQHLAPGSILFSNVVAHATPCRASSLLPCGFNRTNPY